VADTLSGENYTWILPEVDRELLRQTQRSPMLTHLLKERGYTTSDEIHQFFDNITANHDPLLIPDMAKAVRRIKRAIKNKEHVCIYGDFDSDGTASTALLKHYLDDVGVTHEVIVPHRNEGHGPRVDRIEEMSQKGVTLIITVDCGVTSFEEVKSAKKLGIDCVITDHHEPRHDGKLPRCIVVNPNRLDSEYPFGGLCGVGVVYKLLQALNWEPEKYIDLVALGTIADVVPIRDENRGFVIRGVEMMKKGVHIGLTSLLYACDVDPEKLTATTVAFQLAPRINAANRLADPIIAYGLLVSDDMDESSELASQLSDLNTRRKTLLDEYITPILEEKHEITHNLLIVKGSWPPGISGLIASRLVDAYGVPVIAVSDTGGGNLSASARSVTGVSIIDIIEDAAGRGARFLRHGGHSGAAGFIITAANYSAAEQLLYECASPAENRQMASMKIDAEIPFYRVNLGSIAKVNSIGPFGEQFAEPLFLSRCVTIKDQKKIGSDGKHLSLKVCSKTNEVRGVMFGHDVNLENISSDTLLDIVYHMELNTFRGFTTSQVRIKDWRFSDSCDTIDIEGSS
jgi:single-stranded-DNA-specific exonuclease